MLSPHPDARDRTLFEAGECQALPFELAPSAAGNFTAYDDVTPSLIPSNATHVAYYGNGWAANLGKMRVACPHALLSPTLLVQATVPYKQFAGWEHGVSIDVEPSLYTPAGAAAEAKRIIAQGVMPKIYFPLSWMAQVVAALNAAGLKRSNVQLHTAHWTGVPHICSGISTVWGTINADSTQYTDKALGRSLDASLCLGTYYGPWGVKPKPKPKPKPTPSHGQMAAKVTVDWDKPAGHRLSIKGQHTGTWKSSPDQPLEVFQVSVDKRGKWRIAGVPASTPPLGSKPNPKPGPAPRPNPKPKPAVRGRNPVPGWSPTRIDQGVDGTLSAQGYVAPFRCKILKAIDYTPGWKGGWLVYEILWGPFKGQGVFVAEGIKPAVSVGRVVSAGTKIADRAVNGYNGVFGNIETGWVAPNAGESLARTLPGYSGDQSIQAITCGSAFNLFIKRLGGAPGHNNTNLQPNWALLPSSLRKALGV